MAASRISALVSSSWLKKQLTSGPTNLRLLDASWTALQSGKEAYLSKHIPTASFFELNKCVKSLPTAPRNPPEPECFEKYVQSLGVSTDSHLVVYDRGGMLPAARTWWTFRTYGHSSISVLDGGLRMWEAEGYETSQGEQPLPQTGNFQVQMDNRLISKFEDILSIVQTGSSQILDARRPEHFFGEEPEPTGFTQKVLEGSGQPQPTEMHRGHVPGACNLLEDMVLDNNTNCMLPPVALIKLFQEANINLDRPLTTMCYNGHAACLLALAAYHCGKDDTAVYSGSWTEYGQRAQDSMVEVLKKRPTRRG